MKTPLPKAKIGTSVWGPPFEGGAAAAEAWDSSKGCQAKPDRSPSPAPRSAVIYLLNRIWPEGPFLSIPSRSASAQTVRGSISKAEACMCVSVWICCSDSQYDQHDMLQERKSSSPQGSPPAHSWGCLNLQQDQIL